jgi:HME family heavy-metal exporter
MLNGIIRFALRYRMLIVFASLVALVYGGYVTATLPIDVFPDLDRPRVVVMTEAPGLAPEEVETLVTFPLEAALLGATGVQAVRSQSGLGLSVVYVEFDWGADIHRARQTVQERLTTVAGSMPEGIKPQMAPISSIMGQILHIGLYRKAAGAGADRFALRTTADWVVRPRLLKIAGIAQVTVMGGDRKQYQVLVDPTALLTYEVTWQQVEEALKKNNLNASGGFAVQGEEERPIRILGRLGPEPYRVLQDLRDVPVKHTPQRTILLSQVARVVEGPQLKRGDASVNGYPAVVLTVTKQPHVDTRALTEEINAALRELQAALPPDVEINTELFQMKRFIDTGVYNVAEAMAIGAGLVLLILFLFLLNFRTTFISLTAIPLSLVITGLVFKGLGWFTGAQLSINVMTLGGIAVALGELVDDAIVDVENIFRRLRENNAAPQPRPVLPVIYEASVEVRSAIVFGTMMVILVFLPLFALSGIEGRLFTPLGVAYIISILASLLVSLTVTPVLSYYLLPQAKATHRREDSPLLRALKWGAGYLIRFSMARAGTLLLLGWVLVGLAVWVLAQLGADFLPPFDEGSVQVNVSLPPGSSLEASNKVIALVDAKFRQMQRVESGERRAESQKSGERRVESGEPDRRPVWLSALRSPLSTSPDTQSHGEILHFVRRTGRAELDEHVEPVSNTEYILTINPEAGHNRAEMLRQIQAELAEEVPGVDIEVEQPLAHMISHLLSGVTAQIAIKVHGDDLDVLRRTALQIKAAISSVPGLSPPVIEAQRQGDELHLRLRPEQLAFYGVDRAYVADFLSAALKGEEVGQVLEGQRRFDLVVRLDEPYRSDYGNLGRLRLELPDHRGQVPLGELVDIGEGTGPNMVNRENVRRRLVIRCNAQGRDLAGVVADIQARVRDRVRLPEGYAVEYGGQFESQRRATLLISLLAALSFAGMFVVLYMLYPSARVVLQILNALPMAFIGGVLALVVTGQTLTVASMVGFISLGGIAARNGILLVSHYFHLMRHEGEGFTPQMVLRGSLERLSPVLMTALTAGIGLVPLVVAGQEPGREILYPVATVIFGGLITSTLCEYLIHPGLFWRFSGKDAERLTHATEREFDLA